MMDRPDNDEQFKKVLNRLDALMKRGQPAESPTPLAAVFPLPDSAMQTAPSAAEEQKPEPSSTPFVILEESAEIPVLTEIYDGEIQQEAEGESKELAEAVIDALMPLMLENLDTIVTEEAARMQQNITERLRMEIAATLRERLQSRKA